MTTTTTRTALLFREVQESYFRDPDTGVELTVVEKMPITEWLVNNYKSFGAKLDFVTDKSEEGAQFVRGFGGIGGLLRYAVQLEALEEWDGDSDDDFM
ncbi:Electron transfer flavoprotein alpha-subunit [Perkinsus olseni]|uniref:Electron transfer flavoprotein alpha-subunit n=1 Tax=Perkinsus olseni TaxID=32597 RepID=A0A7J6PVL6_PEROL|nr:Electron transfer flavoprotein alpha-subunit [Perkinsus olseni]